MHHQRPLFTLCLFACVALTAGCATESEQRRKAALALSEEEISAALATPADLNAPPADAEALAGGVVKKVLRAGVGDRRPEATSRVTVHYAGWTTDGERFDASYSRGQPISFRLDQVIQGWTVAVQTMHIGEKARIWIPEAMAYEGQAGRPQGTLVFDVELIDID